MQEDNHDGDVDHTEENGEGEAFHYDIGYAAQLEEALGLDEDKDEENELFLYEGEDTCQQPLTSYDEQLRSVLMEADDAESWSTDGREDDNESPELALSRQTTPLSFNYVPSTSHGFMGSPSRYSRFFPHSTFSRLRSFTPQPEIKRIMSTSLVPEVAHVSKASASGTSSPTGMMSSSEEHVKQSPTHEVFRWTPLKDLGQHLFTKKAVTMLGSSFGEPTVLAVNGLICIGTDRGYALVFNFKQDLLCICKSELPFVTTGAVTAVALSRDHTFLAVGYGKGYINLFEISRPHTAARVVIPTTLTVVASGRKEGHIEGSKITGIEFIGSRHTAITSMDESGLVFYHSLGKILFVEATDTLRILGKYSDTSPAVPKNRAHVTKDNEAGMAHHNVRKSSVILAMASLPPGPVLHPTENYAVIALLTPSKLVIVGLKPAPRTWYRKHRTEINGPSIESSKWRGCLAWFPSMDATTIAADGSIVSNSENRESTRKRASYTQPILAYSWDRCIFLMQVMEKGVEERTNDPAVASVHAGTLEFKELANWSTDMDYLSLQWFNAYLLLACTGTHIEVWDIRQPSRVERVLIPILSLSPLHAQKNIDFGCVAHCIRTYKGKIFHLCQHELRVGFLLSWADRILSSVEEGDFLNAIEIARSYYTSTATGNRLGLPANESTLKALVGQRLRDLMLASARYAFSEDRLTDSTHVTPENRGVDRTTLFENMVNTCLDACIALDDFDFIFEDLFESYQNSGITPIFLRQLEPYVLEGAVRAVPPRITQKLIAMHEVRGDYNHAERIIWHVEPECLDVHQAITLCRKQKLYDALIYVYITSLKDYVTPLVELMELIVQTQQIRDESFSDHHSERTDYDVEIILSNAYKIFAYLTDILTGLIYPNQVPMGLDEQIQAKRDIYSFLFFGQSRMSALDEGGKLILTGTKGDSGPSYRHVRLLLHFNAEVFLHTLDIAFEDEFFNDETQFISRLVIVKILLETLASNDLSLSAKTMMNIFIARNVPKYPQSIFTYMTPSSLQMVLLSLTRDNDASSREDRQLAAECLLSIYNPHDHDEVIKLFSQAGFYRILRTWYRNDKKWNALIHTYIEDPDVDPAQIFESLDEVLSSMKRISKKPLPVDTIDAVLNAIGRLLETEVTETAVLVDKHLQDFHQHVLDEIPSSHKRFIYLRCLLEPMALPEETYWHNASLRQRPPTLHLPVSAREQYLTLLCQYDAKGIIHCLNSLPTDFFDVKRAISICEENDVHEAIVWLLDRQGDTKDAFTKLKASNLALALRLGECLTSEREKPENAMLVQDLLDKISGLGGIGLRICLDRSATGSTIAVEDLWFELLAAQVDAAQTVSSLRQHASDGQIYFHDEEALTLVRSLVQTTFTSLISLGPSSAISFPRLFKRLVETVSESASKHSSYSEFKVILSFMIDSYRGEGDLLSITGHLVERDFFEATEQLLRSRSRGSRVREIICSSCKQHLEDNPNETSTSDENGQKWGVQRVSGLSFHYRCLPVAVVPD